MYQLILIDEILAFSVEDWMVAISIHRCLLLLIPPHPLLTLLCMLVGLSLISLNLLQTKQRTGSDTIFIKTKGKITPNCNEGKTTLSCFNAGNMKFLYIFRAHNIRE